MTVNIDINMPGNMALAVYCKVHFSIKVIHADIKLFMSTSSDISDVVIMMVVVEMTIL